VAKLRADGWMPAVVYGEGKEAVSISISEWELEQHVKAHHRVFQLDIAGQAQAAFLQEVSWANTTDRPVHADFKRIDLTKPIESDVEVDPGRSPGRPRQGRHAGEGPHAGHGPLPADRDPGLDRARRQQLEIDQYLTAGQLKLPAGRHAGLRRQDAGLPRRQARRPGDRSGACGCRTGG
jgi:large subunit ribosomal protein L25